MRGPEPCEGYPFLSSKIAQIQVSHEVLVNKQIPKKFSVAFVFFFVPSVSWI